MYYTHTICYAVIILYYPIPFYTILYSTILYYTILYYTILYYTILYYTILYCTVLYCTVLYCAILYYTHLHSLLWRLRISDTEASGDRHPSSSVAWVLQTSMLTNQKHSYLFSVLQQSSREFESSCVLNVLEKWNTWGINFRYTTFLFLCFFSNWLSNWVRDQCLTI